MNRLIVVALAAFLGGCATHNSIINRLAEEGRFSAAYVQSGKTKVKVIYAEEVDIFADNFEDQQ